MEEYFANISKHLINDTAYDQWKQLFPDHLYEALKNNYKITLFIVCLMKDLIIH